MTRTLPLLVLLACTDNGSFVPTDDTGGAADGGGADGGSGDGGSSGTDADGDGWTVEEGDCDDTDIHVNPAWDEDPNDGLDNDCDGRIDEAWRGLTVAYANEEGASTIMVLDSIGREADEITLSDSCLPFWLDHGAAGTAQEGGYVINVDQTGLAFVASDGTCELVLDYSEDPDQPILLGVRTHPDGYYVAVRPGELLRIDPDGASTSLATWAWDYSDADTFEFFAYDLAVDWFTGEVALFDYLGGFATWSEDAGLEVHKQADLSDSWANWDGLSFNAGAAMDGGGWYAAGLDYTNDQAAAIYRWSWEQGDYVQKVAWDLDYYVPAMLTMDGDTGDWYVTANAAQYYRVWKVREVDLSIDDLWISEQVHGRAVYGIVSNY